MSRKGFVIAASACLIATAALPSKALAQRHYGHGHSVVVVGAGFYYNPFFAYSPFYWGLGGWYPFYPPYPYAYPGYWYGGAAISNARLLVKPVDAEVYVDDYYVGRVDNFDGVFQRLDLPAGEHEIVIYRDGYRTFRQKNLFRPGEGYKFQAVLEPLPAGEAQEPRPKPPSPPIDRQQQQPYGPPPDRSGPEPGRTAPLPERRGAPRPDVGGFGTLAVRVQPADAVVTIDGERWDSPEGGSRLQVQLPAGRHRIDVQKDGFKPYSTSIEIHGGATETVNVSLSPGGGL